MRNVQTEVKGGKLVVTIDISEKAVKASPLSTSGKNRLIASTGGNQEINGTGFKLGLNLFCK